MGSVRPDWAIYWTLGKFLKPLVTILTQTFRAVVVAQLVEQSLPIPEVRGSYPVIGKNLFIY